MLFAGAEFCPQLITFANSLDLDQEGQNGLVPREMSKTGGKARGFEQLLRDPGKVNVLKINV